MTTESLLNEAAQIMAKARLKLEENRDSRENQPTHQTTQNRRQTDMTSITLSAQQAGELYAAGQTVDQIAKGNGMSYSQARKLIVASGTPIRDASSRLKGRTRKSA
jgi:hypothetical protein